MIYMAHYHLPGYILEMYLWNYLIQLIELIINVVTEHCSVTTKIL